MATMSVFPPDPMKDWVETQVWRGAYDDAGAYVRDLVQRNRLRGDLTIEFQQFITDGLESGVSDRSMTDVLVLARWQAGVTEDS